jgi:pimeloyl-ACP methyl ester carboxylesterase
MLPPHDLHPPPEPRDFIAQPPINKAQIMRTRITTAPGVELDVIQSGAPHGVPLLLLHGLSDSNASMRPMMDALPRGVRVIAVTQRGHGDSSKPAGPYTAKAFVADAVSVLDQMGVRKAVVYGHSMGSIVAQRLALDHPERVAGLILEGAFPGLKGNTAVEAYFDTALDHLTDPIDPGFLREFQESTMLRPPPPEFVDMVVREAAKLPARAWRQILQDLMALDLGPELAAIRVPTLLLWGDGDTFVGRSDQDRLLAIPGARLVVFEGIGHDPHWEDPLRAAELVALFMARHIAPASA